MDCSVNRQASTLLALLAGLALHGCGGGGGGGGGGGNPPAASNDVSFDNLKSMTGMGGVMVHFDVTWQSRDGQPAEDVVVELQRADGSYVDGTRTVIPAIAHGESAAVHISAEGFADNERLTVVADPSAQVADDNRANNVVTVTAMRAPLPELSDQVDLQFVDAHYHQMYYYNNPEFHFFAVNPEVWGIGRGTVEYAIYDNGVEFFRSTLAENLVNFREHDDSGDTTQHLQIFLPDRVLQYRPTPGERHEFAIHLDPDGSVGEAAEANNWMRFVVDVPTVRSLPTAQVTPDIQMQDPHFHQYASQDRAVFHFYMRNSTTSGQAQSVRWKIVREDGVEIVPTPERIASGGANNPQMVPANGISGSMSFSHTDDTAGEDVEYDLIYDPDDEIEETDETNNRVHFVIDWTPTGFG